MIGRGQIVKGNFYGTGNFLFLDLGGGFMEVFTLFISLRFILMICVCAYTFNKNMTIIIWYNSEFQRNLY